MAGRKPTDAFWKDKVRSLTENEGLSAKKIAERFERSGEKNYPLDRTIARIQAEFRKLDERERRDYRLFTWPGAMELDLPWEAGPACMELVGLMEGFRRPQIRLCRWFWRVSQLAPTAPVEKRRDIAGDLALWELLDLPSSQRPERALQLYFATRAWENENGYEERLFAEDLLATRLAYSPGWSAEHLDVDPSEAFALFYGGIPARASSEEDDQGEEDGREA
jgi:hypothetical protein